jgi:23S rRNA (cytosine1962-C5)-methyltransferase
MNEPIVKITRRGAERLQGGHLWIYRSDVQDAPAALEAGDVVATVDGRGRFLAKAFWSARSKIALRVVTRDEEPVDEAFFAARLSAAIELRERAFGDERFVRLVHGEGDLLPGLVIDRYGDAAVLQTLVPATDRRKALLADLVANALSLRSVVERNDVRVRELEGLAQTKGLLRGEPPGQIEHREGEVRMRVDLLSGQKTGAFLDQRENRLRAGEYARGRCLDCFSYAGGFALQLSRRAERVTAVEMQAGAAALLRENALLNRAGNLEVVEANAFDYLRDRAE